MKPTRYYYGIDIIRFLAATSVLGFHFGYLSQAADFRSIWSFTWCGWIGVEVFFVISGFVIANSANDASPMQFLRGRILRLYPAVWFCATVTLLASTSEGLLVPYLRSMTLLPKGPWISDVYWTLAVEIAFYALIFGLLCLKQFSSLNCLALALTTCSSVYLFLIQLHLWNIPEHLNIFLLRHGCFFSLGLWIWLSTTRPLLTWEYATVGVAIVACVTEIGLTASEFLPRQALGQASIIVPILIWSLAALFIWLSSRGVSPIPPKVATFARIMGLMTYPLYLVHNEAGHKIIGAMISIGVNKWVALAIGTISVIVLSWIICKYWEPPVRKALAYAFDKTVARRIFASS